MSFFREACFPSIEVFNAHFVGGDNSASGGFLSFSAILLAVFDDLKVSVFIFFLAVGDDFICEVINEVGGVLIELVKFCVLIIHICNSFRLLFLCLLRFSFLGLSKLWNYGYSAMDSCQVCI